MTVKRCRKGVHEYFFVHQEEQHSDWDPTICTDTGKPRQTTRESAPHDIRAVPANSRDQRMISVAPTSDAAACPFPCTLVRCAPHCSPLLFWQTPAKTAKALL